MTSNPSLWEIFKRKMLAGAGYVLYAALLTGLFFAIAWSVMTIAMTIEILN